MKISTFFIGVFLFICCDGKKNHKQATNTNTVTPDLERIKSYEAGYGATVNLDTIIDLHGKMYRLAFKMYCLFDSGVNVPKKYNGVELQTHNFAIDLNLFVDNRQIMSKKILKKDFEKIVTKELLDFGVIMYPNFEGYNISEQAFVFELSLSVPVTDIGLPVSFAVNSEGEFLVKKLR